MSFIRYLLVQVAAYAIDMGGFLLLFGHLSVGPIYANVMGKVAAGLFAFLAHRSFTFRVERNDREHRQAVKYFVLLGINMPLSSVLLALLMLVIPYPAVAKFISDVMLVLLNFWLSGQFVFRRSRKHDGTDASAREEMP
ncbi:MAG: GtrA family protein [Xanthomonadaceae bacterium]|jgi:putative flippase GtrA|nr:GtrA family protein [Xanthomonadaceae bacterium]